MAIRLGLFGSPDAIEIIDQVVANYSEFERLSVVYVEEGEITEKLLQHQEEVDMWLFSGQIPYGYAKKSGVVTQPMFYVPLAGSSLYKTLLQVACTEKIELDQLSYDSFHPQELERVFRESGLGKAPAYIKHYEWEISMDELVAFHLDLWEKGLTRGAITCHGTARQELLRLGVPTFRVLPASGTIESVLSIILRTSEMLRFKDTQITVQWMEIDSFAGLVKEAFSTDEVYKVELKMTEKLLNYAKKVHGSLKQAGPGRYVIFSTWGLLCEITDHFTTLPDLEELQDISKEMVTCGIGVGQTVYEAEVNAGTAFLHAKESGKGSWMVMFDDKTISGPLGRREQITYSYGSERLQTISRQTSISVTTLSKLESIMRKIGKREIDAQELAQHMQILPRSARRILTDLEEKALAQLVAEETPNPRGRPRKIYRILL